jgi:DNA-binding Xre family transcriptional regulator
MKQELSEATTMTKPTSTFERKMQHQKFKKAFEKGYKKLLFSELMISIMEGDDVSIRNLAKEADISKSVIQNLRSGKQHDIKVSNLIKIAHAFGFEVILQRGDERLLLNEVTTKDSKKHLSVKAVPAS